ncbi:leukocyte-associated immunoglobulin-like receptor 1 isoform X2 [Carcharodon carcharias]|uniref:leukocyte-associated immunoglobulin-like receptor 1 isoform X2 n=1 Tax=Carcharodon carcharias TaxID=13397 RepID=UPI001B7F5D52|nr:leukocyte-associated immunoglobulin-like receptor 1 isoform X2 [Carcharodon carcharias]
MLCESHWKMFILSFILIIGNVHPSAGEDKEYQLSQPTIFTSPNSGTVVDGENVGISCEADIRSNGGQVHLYKNRSGSPVQSRVVKGNVQTVYFSINPVNEGAGGNYSCRYETRVIGYWKKSPFSRDVTITVTAAPSTPWLNITPGYAAFIVLLPCAALALFLIIKRGRKRKQHTRRNAASTSGDTGNQDADATDGTANVSPNSDTMDVHPEAAPEDQQELNYATLNLEALKQKEAASVTTGDCSIYAEVKKK